MYGHESGESGESSSPRWVLSPPEGLAFRVGLTRSPSSALSHPFFGGGFPYQNRLQKKGTLIVSFLLEDLVNVE